MKSFSQISFLLVCLTTITLSLPIDEPFSSTSIPLNPIEGHFTKSFTNEFELFSSTFVTPLTNDTTPMTKSMEKKEDLSNDHVEMSSSTIVNEPIEQTKRNFDETESDEDESSSKSPRVLMVNSKKGKTLVARGHDDDEEEKPKKNSDKKIKSKDDESVESDEELTTSSALVAEFDPNVFDSVSTPVGTQLKFDENHQSIDRLSMEETSTSLAEEFKEKEKEKEKEKKLNETKLNQVQNSTVVEEEESNH